jgi:low affinity Fe/Cu permease
LEPNTLEILKMSALTSGVKRNAEPPFQFRRETGAAKAGPEELRMEKDMSRIFSRFAGEIARLSGKPVTFILSCLIILIWAVTGPLFGFSDTWQLVINTGTTIVTFLMVFLIQNTQNRDGAAIQAKLDELIRTSAARNAFVGIEHLTPEEVEEIRVKCEQRARAHRHARHPGHHVSGEAAGEARNEL